MSVSLVILLMLTSILTINRFTASAAESNGNENGDPADVKNIIVNNLNNEYADTNLSVESLTDTHYVLMVKNTLVDRRLVPSDLKTEQLYFTEEYRTAEWLTMSGMATLYDGGGDYLIAFVDTSKTNHFDGNVTDATFARNDADGNVLDNCYYDYEHGIAYVPRKYVMDANGDVAKDADGNLVVAPTVQLITLFDPTNLPTATIPVNVTTSDAMSSTTKRFDAKIEGYDSQIELQIAPAGTNIGYDNIGIFVSGADLPIADAQDISEYDSTTGTLTIRISGLTVPGLFVKINNGDWLARLASTIIPNAHADTGAEMHFWPYGSVEYNGGLQAGYDNKTGYYTYNSEVVGGMVAMSGDHATPQADKDFITTVWNRINSAPNNAYYDNCYCWGWNGAPHDIHDPGFNWVATQPNLHSMSDWVNRYGAIDGGHDFIKSHAIRLPGDVSQEGDADHIQVMDKQWWQGIKTPYGDNSWMWFPAGCIHITEPDLQGHVTSWRQNVTCFVRFVELNTTAPSPYVIIAFQSKGFGTTFGHSTYQAAQLVLKLHLKTKGQLQIRKKSSNPAMTDNNVLYNLALAKYGVWNNPQCTGNPITTLTTGSDGRTGTAEVEPSKYYIKEIDPPRSGAYYTSNEIKEVTVNAGSKTTADVTDKPKSGKITIKKVSADANSLGNKNYTLDGAQFIVKNSNNQQVGGTYTAKVNADGTEASVTIDNLPLGKYTITEIHAPTGYEIASPATQTLDVTATNFNQIAKFSEQPTKATLRIVKKSANNLTTGRSEYTLEGTTFKVKNSKHKDMGTITTDKNGIGTISLVYDTYTITETQAPKGFKTPKGDKATHTIELKPNATNPNIKMEQEALFTDEPITVTPVKTLKNDELTHETLKRSGVEFELLDENGNKAKDYQGKEVPNAFTDKDGVAKFDARLLLAQKYEIKEVHTIIPYVVTQTPTDISAVQGDHIDDFSIDGTITEKLQKGRGRLVKTGSENDETLDGAVYDVYAAENITVKNGDKDIVAIKKDEKVQSGLKSGKDGVVLTDYLYIGDDGDGKYYFKETDHAPGHVRDDTPQYFTLKYDKDAADKGVSELPTPFDIENPSKTNHQNKPDEVAFEKNDENGSPIAGATIAFWKQSDDAIVTPDEGKGAFVLRAAQDTDIKVYPRDGIDDGAKSTGSDIKTNAENATDETGTETNESEKATTTDGKTNTSGDKTSDSGTKSDNTKQDDTSGSSVKADLLVPISYDSSVNAFVTKGLTPGIAYDVEIGGRVVKVLTIAKAGDVAYGRYAAEASELFAAGYLDQAIFPKDDALIMRKDTVAGHEVTYPILTDENGRISWKRINDGTYTVAEIKPPYDEKTHKTYLVSTEYHRFKVDTGTGLITKLANDKTTATKMDEPTKDTSEKKENAEDTGETKETDETKATDATNADTTNAGGTGSLSLTLTDESTHTLITKTDVTGGAEIPGASLTVTAENGDIVDSWVSSDQPHEIVGLAPGKYELHEELTPHTYQKATTIPFTIFPDSTVMKVEMIDSPVKIGGEIDKRQEIASPVVTDTYANGDLKNNANVTVSDQGRFDYSLDFRQTGNTWSDEFTVTDEIEGAKDGLARLESFVTPQAYQDYDGLMNVWYQTNKTDGTPNETPARPEDQSATTEEKVDDGLDLTVRLTADKDKYAKGDSATFTLRVQNDSARKMVGSYATATLPKNMKVDSIVADSKVIYGEKESTEKTDSEETKEAGNNSNGDKTAMDGAEGDTSSSKQGGDKTEPTQEVTKDEGTNLDGKQSDESGSVTKSDSDGGDSKDSTVTVTVGDAGNGRTKVRVNGMEIGAHSFYAVTINATAEDDVTIDKKDKVADDTAKSDVTNGDGITKADGDGTMTETTESDKAAEDGKKDSASTADGDTKGSDSDGTSKSEDNASDATSDDVSDGTNKQVEHRSYVNATLSDGHVNAWLANDNETLMAQDPDGDRRIADYTGWRVWKTDVPTTVATKLDVADLNLADDEYITGIRLEYGRVEQGFTTRITDWDRDLLKDTHDDLDNVKGIDTMTFEDADAAKPAAMASLQKIIDTISYKAADGLNAAGDGKTDANAEKGTDTDATEKTDEKTDANSASSGKTDANTKGSDDSSSATDSEVKKNDSSPDGDKNSTDSTSDKSGVDVTVDGHDYVKETDEALTKLREAIQEYNDSRTADMPARYMDQKEDIASRNGLDDAELDNIAIKAKNVVEAARLVADAGDSEAISTFRTIVASVYGKLGDGLSDVTKAKMDSAIATLDDQIAKRPNDDTMTEGLHSAITGVRDSIWAVIDEIVNTGYTNLVHYAPAILNMKVTDAYQEGTTLRNATRVDTYRNGGGENDLDGHDEDKVEQTPKNVWLRTTAVDAKDGDKNVLSEKDAHIIDHVEYHGLIPGQEYTLTGDLHLRDATGNDMGVCTDASGKHAEGKTTFVPDSPDGIVDVDITLDGSNIEDGTVATVFERAVATTLSPKDNFKEVRHEDINDAAQTVTFTKTPSIMGTGDDATTIGLTLAMVTAAVTADLMVTRHKREFS